MRTHADRAYAVALHMTGHRLDAQDVVQDSMVAAWQHLGGFAGQSTFATWLTRIVINTCHNLRRAGRDQVSIDEVDQDWPAPRPGGAWQGGPEQVAVARASLTAAQVAILALPFDQRAALVLHTVAGCTHAQSAKILGISQGAARVRAHRARTALLQDLRQWR